MQDLSPLDNPIWHALTSVHEPMAIASGLARTYHPDISPLTALYEPTEQAFRDLENIVDREQGVGLFTTQEIRVPTGWNILMEGWMEQMIYLHPISNANHDTQYSVLGETDVDAMLALIEATGPGPFRKRTIELGRYLGIRNEAGQMVAIAGQRLHLNGFTEVSAVCTDPAYRGHGYASALISANIEHILASGNVPFLHVFEDNPARHLYKKLGFTHRTRMRLTVISRTE